MPSLYFIHVLTTLAGMHPRFRALLSSVTAVQSSAMHSCPHNVRGVFRQEKQVLSSCFYKSNTEMSRGRQHGGRCTAEKADLLRYFCKWLAMFWRVRPSEQVPMRSKILLGTALSTLKASTAHTNWSCSSRVHSTWRCTRPAQQTRLWVTATVQVNWCGCEVQKGPWQHSLCQANVHGMQCVCISYGQMATLGMTQAI